MNYFVTGCTDFIGRFLVPKLLNRGGTLYLLVRASSMSKVTALRELWGADEEQVIAVEGDLGNGRSVDDGSGSARTRLERDTDGNGLLQIMKSSNQALVRPKSSD